MKSIEFLRSPPNPIKVHATENTTRNETFHEKKQIAPENGWLEYFFPFGMAYFQGLC